MYTGLLDNVDVYRVWRAVVSVNGIEYAGSSTKKNDAQGKAAKRALAAMNQSISGHCDLKTASASSAAATPQNASSVAQEVANHLSLQLKKDYQKVELSKTAQLVAGGPIETAFQCCCVLFSPEVGVVATETGIGTTTTTNNN